VRSSCDGGLYADARLGTGGTGRRRGLRSSITVSPDGTSAYVASTSDDAVAVFDRAGDGTLTQKPGPAGCISDSGAGRCRDGTALDSSHSVAVSPDGQSVYVASASSDAVAVFDRAPNGRLAATNHERSAAVARPEAKGPPRLPQPLRYAKCGNQWKERPMTFQAGDRVVAESESIERPARYGTVRDVVHEDPRARYRIEWDDGRTSVYTPAAGALRLAPETAKRAG
jgi:Domain of unknown function (DUF1918)